ncbi:2-oxoacid:acceptor oxidoreductase family protein [Bacteroidota bacterium]
MITRVRVTGFGGQGVITAGYILGKAAAIYDDKHSVFTQSYGPEARGSACSAQVIISNEKIHYPFIKQQDILVALSQEGFDKHIDKTVKGGKVIIDEDLVEITNGLQIEAELVKVPTTRIAEKNFGNRIVTNIIMLGCLTSFTGIVSKEAMTDAVKSVVPSRMIKLNTDALNYGFEYKTAETVEKIV